MLKVLVIGKGGSIVNWAENTADGFREAGHGVALFPVNGESRFHSLCYKLRGMVRGGREKVVIDAMRAELRRFRPDLVVFVLISANWLAAEFFAAVQEECPAAARVVWVGDKFDPEQGVFAHHVDWVFCTDSAFIDLLRDMGSPVKASYLPLALDPRRFHPMPVPRSERMVFVANRTAYREQVITSIARPITLYGRGWRKLVDSPHEIHGYRLPLARLPGVYASSRAVLNVKNEMNVISGLNQRSFEPYGCMTPVLSDDMADIDRCFVPGEEILIYHSVEELQALIDRLSGDRLLAEAVGLAGHKRVMAEHTYVQRARTMAATLLS